MAFLSSNKALKEESKIRKIKGASTVTNTSNIHRIFHNLLLGERHFYRFLQLTGPRKHQ